MDVNPDFRDLFNTLNTAKVRYLVVGAHAVAFHAEPRYTKDLDLWVDPVPENASRLFQALAEYGAPLRGVTEQDFTDPEMIYQVGIEPNRIDFLMSIERLRFETAWDRRVASSYGGVRIYLLGRQDLIRAKRAAGRPQDLLDVRRLTRTSPQSKSRSRHSKRRPRRARGEGFSGK